MAFDLPTQIGYDSDAAMAEGEWGVRASLSTPLDDFETVFDRIPLDEVSTSMTINAPAAVLSRDVHCDGRQAGRPKRAAPGTIKTTS